MPNPKKNESHDDYIDRCMGDVEAVSDFPDEKQRLAFCESKWSDRSMNKKENRYIDFAGAEIRAVHGEDGNPGKICGYFAKFNSISEEIYGFREVIEPGFFHDALLDSDVIDLFNHDPNIPLGRQSAPGDIGSLKIWEDEIGLAYELKPVNTQAGRDIFELVDKQVIKGCSFGFETKSNGDRWEEAKGNDLPIRYLVRNGCKKIYDGSQVTFPAYPDTEVALRSLEQHNLRNKPEFDIEEENENIEIELLSLRAGRK